MLTVMANFPRPRDITGVRSWFGLVEQVPSSFSKSERMLPFQKLLVKNAKYAWDEQLQLALDVARKEIVQLVSAGVKSFQLWTWTCLITDWSRTGIGFVLRQ